MTDVDVLVVGGGAGGLSAARNANRHGASVSLVTDGPLGGDCTWTGCVPSKTLLAAAAQGLSFDEAMGRVRATVASIAAGEDEETLRREGLTVERGRARLLGRGRVDVDGRVIEARHVVLATGSRPTVPPVDGLAHVVHHTSDSIWSLEAQPRRLVVLGGGAIGCELAQAFARLGTEVTIVDAAARLLPGEEPEAADVLARALISDGLEVRVGDRVRKVEAREDGVRLHAGDGELIDADVLLVATGRRAATDGLGLEEAGVEVTDEGAVVVRDGLATTADGVWAVGDVTGRHPFTHAAHEMGRVVALNVTRRRQVRFVGRAIPRVTYTSPEIASVGMNEAEGARHGGRVAYVPFTEVDRARTVHRTEGFVKLVAGPRTLLRNVGGGQILGATVAGEAAGELINEVALAMRARMFAGRLAQTVHAYPTWGLGLQMAAGQLFQEVDGRSARLARRP